MGFAAQERGGRANITGNLCQPQPTVGKSKALHAYADPRTECLRSRVSGPPRPIRCFSVFSASTSPRYRHRRGPVECFRPQPPRIDAEWMARPLPGWAARFVRPGRRSTGFPFQFSVSVIECLRCFKYAPPALMACRFPGSVAGGGRSWRPPGQPFECAGPGMAPALAASLPGARPHGAGPRPSWRCRPPPRPDLGRHSWCYAGSIPGPGGGLPPAHPASPAAGGANGLDRDRPGSTWNIAPPFTVCLRFNPRPWSFAGRAVRPAGHVCRWSGTHEGGRRAARWRQASVRPCSSVGLRRRRGLPTPDALIVDGGLPMNAKDRRGTKSPTCRPGPNRPATSQTSPQLPDRPAVFFLRPSARARPCPAFGGPLWSVA